MVLLKDYFGNIEAANLDHFVSSEVKLIDLYSLGYNLQYTKYNRPSGNYCIPFYARTY